jgi:tetratricopeptide (TPR) repeat protein
MKTNRPKERPRVKQASAAVESPISRVSREVWRRRGLLMLALWTFALLAYSNSFRTGFPFDNAGVILLDTRIRAATPENLHLILTQEYWYQQAPSGLYRPLSTFTYLLNYAIFGNGANSAGYHWVNFALHAVNIALVYLLGLLLFQESRLKERLAFALAAVWAVHPVLTESVTNIVGRADLLAGFGVLAGLLCHVQGGAASGWRKLAWLCGLALAAAIGLFSKESAVVVLAAMLIYDLAFHQTWRARATGYLALALSFSVFFDVRDRVLTALPAGSVAYSDNPLIGADFWTARLTAVKIVGKYLWLLLWPSRLSCDYSYNQIPLFNWRFNNWEDWKMLAALAACAALAAVAMVCHRRSKPVFFFVAFFFAALAPTSNLVILIGTIMAERFLYLPSIGFAGCLVAAVYAVCRRLPARWPGARIVAPAALALVCGAFAVRTYARNFDWFDDMSLWTSAVKACPDSYKTHTILATKLITTKGASLDTAVREADRALAILDPLPASRSFSAAYANAGACYRLKGDTLSAPQNGYWFRKALDALLHGQRIDLANNQYAQRGDWSRSATPVKSAWFQLYLELGRAYLRLSDPRKAVEAFQYGRAIQPDVDFFEEMAIAYRAMGDPQQAAITLMEGLGVDSSHTQFASELVNLYQQTEPRSCAVRNVAGSVSLNLDCPLVHGQLCTASRNVALLYRQMNREPMAVGTARSAIYDLGCPVELFR